MTAGTSNRYEPETSKRNDKVNIYFLYLSAFFFPIPSGYLLFEYAGSIELNDGGDGWITAMY